MLNIISLKKKLKTKTPIYKKLFIVFIKENNTLSSRLGISISSKHVNAVNRNKFKRRTREAVRSLPDNKHFDILVVGNKDSSNLKPAEILKVLKSHPLL